MNTRDHNPAQPEASVGENIKRIGCTGLTVVVMLLLLCSLIYFVTGVSAIFVQFYQSMIR